MKIFKLPGQRWVRIAGNVYKLFSTHTHLIVKQKGNCVYPIGTEGDFDLEECQLDSRDDLEDFRNGEVHKMQEVL